MNNPSTNNRVAKLLEMAQNATHEGKNKEALKCYNAILQIDPNNAMADFYVFLLTPYKVDVYDPQISEYYNTLISKFQIVLNSLKDKNLSSKELYWEILGLWNHIKMYCFRYYTNRKKYSTEWSLLKEIQGNCIRLYAAEKVGDCIIAEFPEYKDIAVEVWGYEVGVIYQSIAELKEGTKYDPDSIDIWESNPMTCDIYQAARKILDINNKYLSPYEACPQEIEEFFERQKAEREAEEARLKKEEARLKKMGVFCVIILVIILIWIWIS